MHWIRSSERRRLTPRLAALLLTLAAALAALLPGSVGVGQAQGTAGALVINTGQMRSGSTFFTAVLAQAFTTGDSDTDYTLISIELLLDAASNPPTVTLHSGSATGLKVADFTSPSRVANGITPHTFTPTTTVTLNANTEYWVVAENNDAAWTHTTQDAEDAGAESGWSIADVGQNRSLMSTGHFADRTNGHAYMLRVNGTVAPPPVLVSNTGQSLLGATNLSAANAAQSFTTGSNGGGYTLTDIHIRLATTGSATPPTMTLHSVSAAGTKVADFTGPSALVANSTKDYTFTATGTVTLSASTEYWVVLGKSVSTWLSTASDGEDSASARGWSIGDVGQLRTTSTGPFSDLLGGNSHNMRVNGTTNPLVLVSNIGHSDLSFLALTTFDLAQPFTVGSHNEGYELISIDIRLNTGSNVSATLALTLHSGSGTGTKVADFTGPSALDASTAKNYTFTPTTPVTLAASTEYWLMVQGAGLIRPETSPSDHEDGTPLDGASIGNAAHSRSASSTGAFAQHDASTPVLKIRVRGVRSNSAATGAPGITAPNVFRVPAVLGVDLSGIADTDGVTGIATTATYMWQRFAADGTTLEAANIGTGDTYKLTDADAGKKLKVSVSFKDDDLYDDVYAEGPLTSDATAAITAAASCDAPAYVGGATSIWTGSVAIERTAGIEYGYGVAGGVAIGNLHDTSFTVGSNSYTVDAVLTTNIGALQFSLDKNLDAVEKRTLALHVCNESFRFGAATAPNSDHDYGWLSTGLDWSPYAERMVYISQDTVAPTFTSATVNGTSLVMTFSEELGAAASLANSAFTVKKGSGGTTQTLSSTAPSISGSAVTLTLATAVTATDTDVNVLYTKPSTDTANKLVDAFGNEAVTFTADPDVGNLLADSIPPTLSSDQYDHLVSGDGLSLTLTFSESLKESSVPAASAFTVKVTPEGGSETEVELAPSGGVTVSGSTVVLKPAVPITHNDSSVKVTYEKPGTGAVIEDANGNDAASFTDRAVENFSAVPRVSIERVYADASSLIAHAVFRIRRSDMGAANLNVELSLSQADTYLEIVDATTVITSGQTEKELTLSLDYAGNTSGDLTVTVAEGAGYAPAQDGSFRESKWFYERARGQYQDARGYLTAQERRQFGLTYPKSQVFSKTDMAKYENVWRGKPETVSRGAQKNFVDFASHVGSEWNRHETHFNEFYYRAAVAKAIIFKEVERIVSQQTWYQGGYRANIVAYTIAKLGHEVSKRNKAINFEAIWRAQQLSPALRDTLTMAAKVANDIIVDAPPNMRNVTEWAKQQACWNRVSEAQLGLPQQFEPELLNPGEVVEAQREAVSDQRILNGIEAQTAVVQAGPEFWSKVSEWGEHRQLVSPDDRSFLAVAMSIPSRIPSEKQSARLLEILSRLQEEGCPEKLEGQ